MKSFRTLSLMAMLLFAVSCGEKKDFNSDEWKNWVETESEPNTRWLMHKDLLKKYELKGVSKDSILSLLGEPSKKYSDEFNYYLGYSGRGINIGTMTITFENGSVVDVKITDG